MRAIFDYPLPSFIYLSGAIIFLFCAFRFLKSQRNSRFLSYYFLATCVVYAISILLVILLPVQSFAAVTLLAWTIFAGGTLLLALIIRQAIESKLKLTGGFYSLILLVHLAITIDVFLIEPACLEIDRLNLQSEKLKREVKIALVTDLQTDHFGNYEKTALDKVLQEKPDLILLCGDYIQCMSKAEYDREGARLTGYLKESNFGAPLGAYAVRGNTELPDWQDYFKGSRVETFEQTTTFPKDQLVLTALNFYDSFNSKFDADLKKLAPAQTDRYHIVFGHAPDFARSNTGGDLLLAGHTHGGQVCAPGFGPLVYLSTVERKWASGYNRIFGKRDLVVSRGIGMERCYAPRLRFFCHPQLIIITVKPKI
ncbi:MAG: metallophosphoesterase [Candidatus Obscuribacter sp.]|nr:metallophosphoesterase [Candidatus Obscuribacter sp.]